MSYIIPAILALIVGYILWQLKRERLSLTYDITESDSFPTENGSGRYFVILLTNRGNKAIEDTSLEVDFNAEVIETISYSQEKLLSDIVSDKEKITAKIPLLNPKESLKITITTGSSSHINSPKFLARATGVTAISSATGSEFQNYSQMLYMTVAIMAAAYSVYTVIDIYKKPLPRAVESLQGISTDLSKIKTDLSATSTLNIELKELKKKIEEKYSVRNKGNPHTAQVVFSIFNQSDLSPQYFEYVESVSDITYWRTGVYLMNGFLRDKGRRESYESAMELLTDQESVATSSQGFNLYLLAKMKEHQGKTKESLSYLKKCKEKAPLMYEHLMVQDPAFNTSNIETYFLSNGKD